MVDGHRELQDRVALVIGAGKGIGRALATGLAMAGADVAVVSRTPADLQTLGSSIEAGGTAALTIRADATRSNEVDAAVAQTIERFGKIDVLVNAAGGNLRKSVVDTSDAEWDAALRANLTSAFYTCRAVGRHMLARKRGSVINISSSAGLRGRPNAASYSASKAGLINFSRALAMEWAPAGIRVNVLCPGRFLTPATAGDMQDPDKLNAYVKNVPLGRIGQPDELQPLAVWLASDKSGFATGSVIVLDGGQTLL